MIQNVLRHLGGIDVYGVVSVCLFFAVFLGVLGWAARLKASHLETMARLPLDSEPESDSSRERTHE